MCDDRRGSGRGEKHTTAPARRRTRASPVAACDTRRRQPQNRPRGGGGGARITRLAGRCVEFEADRAERWVGRRLGRRAVIAVEELVRLRPGGGFSHAEL